MDGETKSGPLTRQSDHLHTWKGGSTGWLRLETVSLIAANMCQANRGEASLPLSPWRGEALINVPRAGGKRAIRPRPSLTHEDHDEHRDHVIIAVVMHNYSCAMTIFIPGTTAHHPLA